MDVADCAHQTGSAQLLSIKLLNPTPPHTHTNNPHTRTHTHTHCLTGEEGSEAETSEEESSSEGEDSSSEEDSEDELTKDEKRAELVCVCARESKRNPSLRASLLSAFSQPCPSYWLFRVT